LRDVDRAAAKAPLAIHQVIAPEIVEAIPETGELAACDGFVIAVAPALHALGIFETDADAI
jgi:hypothetical protein